jgi:hypothetical protein
VNGQSPNLAAVVKEIADTLRRYRLRDIVGDRFAGQWSRQEFQRAGITYKSPEITRDGRTIYVDRSTAYLEVGPLFLQGLVDLLDHPDQQREFQRLERRARQGGADIVDHPKGGHEHDDHANSFALAATMLVGQKVRSALWIGEPFGYQERLRARCEEEQREIAQRDADYKEALADVLAEFNRVPGSD